MSVKIYNYPVPLRQNYTFASFIGNAVNIELQLQVDNGAPYYDPNAVWHISSQKVWPEGEERSIGGLAIGSNGKITGTATAIGRWIVELYAVVPYQGGYVTTATKEISIIVRWAPTPPVIEAGQAWSGKVGVSGNWKAEWGDATGAPNLGSVSRWSAIGLPQGLEIDALTGVITGEPGQVGVFPIEITAVGGLGAELLRLQVSNCLVPDPVRGSVSAPSGSVGGPITSAALNSYYSSKKFALKGRRAPTLTAVPDNGGSGAIFTPILTPTTDACGRTTWAVSSVSVEGDSSGYRDNDYLHLNPQSGDVRVSYPQARIHSDSGRVVSVTVEDGGKFYREDNSLPIIAPPITVLVEQTFPSAGSGAVITAQINTNTNDFSFGTIQSFVVENGGSGYLRFGEGVGFDTEVIPLTIQVGPPKIIVESIEANAGAALSRAILVESQQYGPATSWSLAGAPEGMVIDNAGILTWPDPVSGDFVITVSATGVGGSDSRFFSISILEGGPRIIDNQNFELVAEEEFSKQIQHRGSGEWSVVGGALPIGVELSDGYLAGVPTGIGNFSFTAKIHGSLGQDESLVTISVSAGKVKIVRDQIFYTPPGRPFSFNVQVENATGAPAQSWTAERLPEWAVLSSGGTLSGVAPEGYDDIFIQLNATGLIGEDSAGARLVVNWDAALLPSITSNLKADVYEGDLFEYTILADRTSSFSVNNLGAGWQFNAGVISAAAPTVGSYTIDILAQNAYGAIVKTLNVNVYGKIAPVVTSGASSGFVLFETFFQVVAAGVVRQFSATGLPPGVSIDSQTGLISGVPTSQGSYEATVYCQNEYGQGSAGVAFNIQVSVPVITSSLTGTIKKGVPFYYQIEASGATQFGATGLPSGLVINSNTGVISGTPQWMWGENETIGISAISEFGRDDESLVLSIIPIIEITSPSRAAIAVGQSLSYQIVARSDVSGPFNYSVYGAWSWDGDDIPVSVDSNGLISSAVATQAGEFYIDISAEDSGGNYAEKNLTLSVASELPAITSAATANGIAGQNFSYQITASNFPISYTASGLPAGLSLNTQAGLISGLPGAEGLYTVSIGAVNGLGSGTAQLTISVGGSNPTITSAGTASGVVGQSFSYQITASNSPSSYTASGLPAGLSLNTQTGLISGLLETLGVYTVSVGATNAAGSGSAQLAISVLDQRPVITSSATASGTVGVLFNYQITASNSPTGYAASGLPAGLSLDSITGLISGTLPIVGAAEITVSATNQYGSGSLGVTISFLIGLPQITSSGSLNGAIGGYFSHKIEATNNATYSVTGLPPWLSFAGDVIAGMPIGAGNYQFTIFASNSTGQAYQNAALSVLNRNPASGVLFAGNNAPTEMRQVGVWDRALDSDAVSRLYSRGRGIVHPRIFYNLYRDTKLKGLLPRADGFIHSKNSLPLKANWIAAGGGYSVALVPVDEDQLPLKSWGLLPATMSGSKLSPISEVIGGNSKLSYISAGHSGGMLVRSDDFMIAYGDAFRNDTKWGKVAAVSAGYNHYLSVGIDGKVKSWGNNDFGQTNVPSGLVACNVCAGRDFSLALKPDGSVVSWGKNNHYQVERTNGLLGVKAIASGYDHVLVLKMDGSVAAYGLNDRGQADVPAGINDVIEVAAGDGFSVALRRDGSAYFWGQKQGISQSDFTEKFFKKITAGESHLLALGLDGSVFSFGGPALPEGNGSLALSSSELSYDDIVANDWVVVGGALSSTLLLGDVMKCGIQDGAYFGIKAKPGSKVAHLRNVSLPGKIFAGGIVVDEACKVLDLEFSAKGEGACLGVKFYSNAESAEYFSLTAARWDDVDWDFTATAGGQISIDILGGYAFYAVKAESASLFIMAL